MQRLTRGDAAVLKLETDITAAHGMVVAVLAGPRPPFSDLRARIEERLASIPRYRQRLIEVPYELARPVWINDPNFTLDFHLRHTALPEPTEEALHALIGRMQTQRIDRHKPLWELWIVDGLADGRWAILSKVHYAIIDGVSGSDILGLLDDALDLPPIIRHPRFESVPSDREMVVSGLLDLATDPLEAARATTALLERPVVAFTDTIEAFKRASAPDGLGRATGPHRRWTSTQVSLEDLRTIRKRLGVSTTDTILAAVSGGIRRMIVEGGRPMPQYAAALVPLAVNAARRSGSGQITAIQAMLPIANGDALETVERIHAQTASEAEESGAIAGAILRRQDDFVAPTILGQGVRAALLTARRQPIDTSVINVPGPRRSLSVLGQPLEAAYPVIPLIGGTRLSVAAISIGETVNFGITGDWDTTSHIEAFGVGLSNTINELLAT